MEPKKIVWVDLSDSQKAELLQRARTYLQEQKHKQKIRLAFLRKFGILPTGN